MNHKEYRNHEEYLRAILEMPIDECINHYIRCLDFYAQDVEPLLFDSNPLYRTLLNKIKKRIDSYPDA